MGRRLAFNATLFLAGVFGLAVGGGPSWIGTCGLYAAMGVGVGGNLPVDGVPCRILSHKMVVFANFLLGTVSRVSAKCVPELIDSPICMVADRAAYWVTHCLGFPHKLCV